MCEYEKKQRFQWMLLLIVGIFANIKGFRFYIKQIIGIIFT